ERADDGHDIRVQRGDEVLEQLEADTGGAAGEPVGDEQELCPHDVAGRRRALTDTMLEDEPPVELPELARVDARPLAHAHAGREPVDGLARDRLLDDRATGTDALCHAAGELDA